MSVLIRSFGNSISQAWQQLAGNKLRSSLSLLGVSIGIFCIVAVQTAVDSLQSNVVSSLSKLGDNTFYIQRLPWNEDPGTNWWKYQRRPPFTYDEYEALANSLRTKGLAGYYAIVGGRTLRWRSNSVEGIFTVAGSPEMQQFFGYDFASGRNITQAEYNRGSNVIVLGATTATELFGDVDPIGREVRIFGQELQVVGVLEKSGEDLLQVMDFDDAVLLSYAFLGKAVNLRSNVVFNSLMAQPVEGTTREELEDMVKLSLRSERRLKPMQDDNFSINSLSMITSLLEGVFSTLNTVGYIIGAFAIFVGGFSVANIMFVSVRERTSLIGVKMALGASRSIILLEFLIESVLLCLVGGVAGLGLVLLAILGLNQIMPYEITLSLGNVILGLVLAVIIGVVSGIIPAWMAAKMDPVEAIRS